MLTRYYVLVWILHFTFIPPAAGDSPPFFCSASPGADAPPWGGAHLLRLTPATVT